MKANVEVAAESGTNSAARATPYAADARAPFAIVAAIAGAVAAVVMPRGWYVALLGILPAARLLRPGPQRRRALRRVASLIPIAAAAGLVRGWSARSTGVPLDAVIELVAQLGLRIGVAALWTTWLGATYSAVAIDRGLVRLGVPVSLAQLLSLTRRFAGQLGQTATAAWSAAAVRGGFGCLSALSRTFGALAGVVLVRALDRTERVADAMAVRGHDLGSNDR